MIEINGCLLFSVPTYNRNGEPSGEITIVCNSEGKPLAGFFDEESAVKYAQSLSAKRTAKSGNFLLSINLVTKCLSKLQVPPPNPDFLRPKAVVDLYRNAVW